MTPLIGITTGRIPVGPRVMEAVDTEYTRAVRAAGAVPLVVPALDPGDPGAVMGRIDGLLLSGGGDIEPSRYGAETSPACGGMDSERDGAEIALACEALRLGVPILAICRGCQLLNVALGGTLVQDLPEVTTLGHLHPRPRNRLVHEVSVEPGSLLGRVIGESRLQVNSIHHQAVDRPGSGLAVVARAPDGVVEGVEMPGAPVLGVQWHPESLVPAGPHAALFAWLSGAARG